MRERDYDKLNAENGHYFHGGLPNLGKPMKKGGYRWCVGFVQTASGKPTPWREYLGHDLLLAQYRAREMNDAWSCHVDYEILKSAGADGRQKPIEEIDIPPLNREQAKAEAWQGADEAMRTPARLAKEMTVALQKGGTDFSGPALAPGFKLIAVPVTPAAEVSIENQQPETLELTLQSAMRRWIKHLEKRFENRDLSEEYLLHIKSVTAKRIRELVPDYELKKTGKPELSQIRMAFQSRKTWRKTTIEKELRNVITFFNWLDDSELWPTPPRKWERSLRPVFRNDHVDEVPGEKAHDTYTMAELTKLYQSAGYSMRLWILLVLNFAWGQTEIATALCNHFGREKPELRRVRRYRHKRKPGTIPIPGHWQAWPETWEAAIQRIDKCSIPVAPKRVAFLTAQNQPLVRIVGKKRYDAIGEAFSSLCKVAGVRDRGFYLLRHTGINLVKKISNSEMADLYSQHAPVTVSQKFYENADWKELRKVLRRLRRKLQPMFEAAISKKDRAVEADSGGSSVINRPGTLTARTGQ